MDQAALVIFDAVGHDQPSKVLDQVRDTLRHRLSIPMPYQQHEVCLADAFLLPTVAVTGALEACPWL